MKRKVAILEMRRLLLILITVILCLGHTKAQISKVNVTIDGPGVVDEYMMLDADGKKQLKLKAVPSKFLGNVIFDGWSGDASGTNEELIVSPDKAQNIHAKFTYHRPVKKYPLLNLKQSWADMGKPLYYEMPTIWETQDQTLWRGTNYLPVDYNRDGYLDYIQFPKKGGMGTDNHRENVRFWLGKPDGSFDEDPLNDNRMLGTVYSIIVKYADFNDDGFPDFCSYSSGYDRSGTTGDYPVVLMSDDNCVYHDLRFTDYDHGYFHGGATGDIDNDGDIDILFWDMNHPDGENSLYLENEGKGNFTKHDAREILDLTSCVGTFPGGCDVECIDLNNDGYNDLIFCAHDHVDNTSGYVSTPVVLWGSSSGKFGGTNSTMLPEPRLGYGITTSLCFYDFNGDGIKEIIVEKNGDGEYGGTSFYRSGYLQVCELVDGAYVDKTEQYIPVENHAFNREKSEIRMSIENIEGTDYLIACEIDGTFRSGVYVGVIAPYAIRNGVLESLESEYKTKVPSFDEGFPLYVDGPLLSDIRNYSDGVNPVDTMAEHHWVDITEGDESWGDAYSGGGSGNLWRINMAHRKDTHYGRTCIRWNRDGLDPNKEVEKQGVSFMFVSDVDISKLREEGYFVELYIKNSDPDLTLSFNGVEIGAKDTDEGIFTGEWQRMSFPLNKMWDESWNGFWVEVGKGDLNNEFYLDDIRIRRLADSSYDDYDRAFIMDYLDNNYFSKDRTAQVGAQEFKAMLKVLIDKFAPDSMNYFNSYITDYEVPLSRGMATCMAYYTARCIGVETNNAITGEHPADLWGCDFNNFDELLPHWGDSGEDDAPEDMFWRDFGGWMTCFYWNFCHASDKSGINIIALDKEANSFHWDDPLTWEDAICAITRLYDSLDPGKKVVGDLNGDGVVNAADIVELINGGGEVNPEEIKTIVNIIMTK